MGMECNWTEAISFEPIALVIVATRPVFPPHSPVCSIIIQWPLNMIYLDKDDCFCNGSFVLSQQQKHLNIETGANDLFWIFVPINSNARKSVNLWCQNNYVNLHVSIAFCKNYCFFVTIDSNLTRPDLTFPRAPNSGLEGNREIGAAAAKCVQFLRTTNMSSWFAHFTGLGNQNRIR